MRRLVRLKKAALPILPTIHLHWCKRRTVEAAEAMVEEDALDVGVAEDAVEEEPT